jgi:hypothetical protein
MVVTKLATADSHVKNEGALAALKKAGQQPGEFLTHNVNRE